MINKNILKGIDSKFLGAKIRHQRKLQCLSLQGLADKLQVYGIKKSRSHIFEIEKGRADPFISTLYAISLALGVDIRYLIDSKYNIGTYPHDITYCPNCNKIESYINY